MSKRRLRELSELARHFGAAFALGALAFAFALPVGCASKPLPAVAPPAPPPPGPPPPIAELREGPGCERHKECAAGFECTYNFASWNRCVRHVSVAELLAWRKELDGINIIVNTGRLVPIDWRCSAPQNCVAEHAFSLDDGHHGPVKDYIKLLSADGTPRQCQQVGNANECEPWRSILYKILGKYDQKRDAFIVEQLDRAM